MGEQAIAELVLKARQADPAAREQLISQLAPQVRGMAAAICGRPLDWHQDEASISLIALNEAIDSFDAQKGMSFLNYVRMVIHRRLVDYFRREAKNRHISLDVELEESGWGRLESEQAWAQYREEEEAREKEEMMTLYQDRLNEFGITIDDLIGSSPKHRDTRQNLMQAAKALAEEPQLLNKLRQQKHLPVKELMLLTGFSRKVIETGRRYIIALTLVLSEEEFRPIKQLINFPWDERSGEGGQENPGHGN
ncbi:MAG: RNA polymerase sigma-I factor [Bacillota bacterium]